MPPSSFQALCLKSLKEEAPFTCPSPLSRFAFPIISLLSLLGFFHHRAQARKLQSSQVQYQSEKPRYNNTAEFATDFCLMASPTPLPEVGGHSYLLIQLN